VDWVERHRDDVDRLLIIAGLGGSWLALPFVGSPVDLSPDVVFADVVVVWATVLLGALFAAILLWREMPWARWPLLVCGGILAAVGLASLAQGDRQAGIWALGGLVVVLGASRLRVPAVRIRADDRSGTARADGIPAARPSSTARRRHADGDAVIADFVGRASRLGVEDLRALGAAARLRDPERVAESRVVASAALRASRRTREFEEVREDILAWEGAQVGPWTWAWASMTDIDRGDVRREAAPALMDAAMAIIARDLVRPEVRESLAGPWLEVVAGRPVLA